MDVVKQWQRFQPLPFGPRLFSLFLGKMIPYTGSISAQIEEIKVGYVKIRVEDCKKIRNHLNSIHAVALMNLGEMTTGLAVYSALPKNFLAILTHLEIDYHKKARGTLHTELQLDEQAMQFSEGEIKKIPFVIQNAQGEKVSSGMGFWKVGVPKKSS